MSRPPATAKRNPVLPPRLPTVPPRARSRAAHRMTASAAAGRFELQHCRDCGAVQYPPRDVCRACLSDRLDWREVAGGATLEAHTTLHVPYAPYFRERAPWRTGLVRLDAGPAVVAFVDPAVGAPPTRVAVAARLDRAGQAVLVAAPEGGATAGSATMREFSASPTGRKVLVTDAASAAGLALVRAFCATGADTVWAGRAEPWGVVPGLEEALAHPAVTVVPLDVTDGDSVTSLAGRIGGRTDIVVSTAEPHRPGGALAGAGIAAVREEMDVAYLGLVRLSRAFAPALAARAAEGPNHAVAWVNILSILALGPLPGRATVSAAHAAANAFALAMRAELRPAGLRVVNVYPGLVDEGWNQRDMPPKIAPSSLARAVLAALEDGIEDVLPDAVARHAFERWREDPAAYARESEGAA